jgi:exopolysaccharide production protein ExoQ
MPPILALSLTLVLVGYLLWRDSREEPVVSRAVWIPILWLMINGSRQISMWFGGDSSFGAQRLEDGTLIDKLVYGALIAAGVIVLVRRQVRVGEILRNNVWLVLLFLFAGLSVLWSDFPAVTFKRWAKSLGDPVMVLVLWSELAPARAITATIQRCAYVLIPLSVVFCKYYENLGRTFDSWGGSGYTGVTTDKNMLGYLLFAFGLFFAAALIGPQSPTREGTNQDRSAKIIAAVFIAMIWWLFAIADSKTPLMALIIGSVIIAALRFATVRRHFGRWAFATVLAGAVLQVSFSITEDLAEGAGRDATFTGRTGLWETLLKEPINPLVGEGYASFWLGARLLKYWDMYPTSPPIQAHNGYLEVYLNLGLIGVFLMAGVLMTGLSRIRRRATSSTSVPPTSHDNLLNTFGISFGIAYLFYNVTEATFQGLSFLFTIFLILIFHYPKARAPARVPLRSVIAPRRREQVSRHVIAQVRR